MYSQARFSDYTLYRTIGSQPLPVTRLRPEAIIVLLELFEKSACFTSWSNVSDKCCNFYFVLSPEVIALFKVSSKKLKKKSYRGWTWNLCHFVVTLEPRLIIAFDIYRKHFLLRHVTQSRKVSSGNMENTTSHMCLSKNKYSFGTTTGVIQKHLKIWPLSAFGTWFLTDIDQISHELQEIYQN